MLGLDGAKECGASNLLKGAAHKQFLSKRPRKPKNVLTVDMVKWLEHLVQNGASVHDRVFAGFILACSYGRLRFSDAQRISSLVLETNSDDEGFLEFQQKAGKTANSKEKKVNLIQGAIPLECLRPGVSWARRWLADLKFSGLVNEIGL